MTSISVLVGRIFRTRVISSVNHVIVSADDEIVPGWVHGAVMSHYEFIWTHKTHEVYKVMSSLAFDVTVRARISC